MLLLLILLAAALVLLLLKEWKQSEENKRILDLIIRAEAIASRGKVSTDPEPSEEMIIGASKRLAEREKEYIERFIKNNGK